jgi:hypothetical protein
MAEKYTSWPSFCAPTETERCRFGEVVAKPGISGEASARGVEICMYGFGGGFRRRFLPDPPPNQKIIDYFLSRRLRAGGRVTCETRERRERRERRKRKETKMVIVGGWWLVVGGGGSKKFRPLI